MTIPRTYSAQVRALRDALRAAGVSDERVIQAITRVPRHEFVDSALAAQAYEDRPLPLRSGVTISQPSTVARMTAWLALRPGERVLEVGTGSGYQAAVLCELGARVYSVERHAHLRTTADALLSRLGYRAVTRAGDGTYGWPGLPPFDAIVVTAGGPVVPDEIKAQLRLPEPGQPDARMVIPVGPPKTQTLLGITRTGEATWRETRLGPASFVPLVRTA